MRPVLLIYERVTTPNVLPNPKPAPAKNTLTVSNLLSDSETLPIKDNVPNPLTEPAPVGVPLIVHQALPLLPTLDEDSYVTFLNNIQNELNKNYKLQVEIAIQPTHEKTIKINNINCKIQFTNTVYINKMSNRNFKIPSINNLVEFSFIIMNKIDFDTIEKKLKKNNITDYFGTENNHYAFLTIPSSSFEICFAWCIPTSFINILNNHDCFFFQGNKKLTNFFKDSKIETTKEFFFLSDVFKAFTKKSELEIFILSNTRTENVYVSFQLDFFFKRTSINETILILKNELDVILKLIDENVKTVICQEDFLFVIVNIEEIKLVAAFNEGQPLYNYLISKLINKDKIPFLKNAFNYWLHNFDDCSYLKVDNNPNPIYGVLKLKAGDVIDYVSSNKGENIPTKHTLKGNIYYYPSLKYNFKSIRLNSPCLIMNKKDYKFFYLNQYIINTTRNFASNEGEIRHVHDFYILNFFNLTTWIFNKFTNEDYCISFEDNKTLEKNADSTKVNVSDYQFMFTVPKNCSKDDFTQDNQNNFVFFVKYLDNDQKTYECIAFPIEFKIIVENDKFLKKVDNIHLIEYFYDDKLIIIKYDYQKFLQKFRDDSNYYSQLISDLLPENNDVNLKFTAYLNLFKDILS